jgi:hypothetical protein
MRFLTNDLQGQSKSLEVLSRLDFYKPDFLFGEPQSQYSFSANQNLQVFNDPQIASQWI